MLQSLRYILTIAEVERRMLYRKAKFWVLAGIGTLVVIMFLIVTTVVTIVEDGIPGEFLLEGTDAYLALYFFSYIQAVLIIFVAGDFRNAEEKARLDQVMLSKPMTTANWVLGKYFGVVSGLLYLNLFLLVLATVGRTIKVLVTGAGFNVLPFFKYFAISALPSILFMTAFIFFLVSLLRVQALALMIAAAYVASIWFYFHHKFGGLIDYGCFFAPLFWSDFIGFGDITAILWQRLFFILIGFAFLGLAIIWYPRLWQSQVSKRMSQAFATIFLAAGVTVAWQITAERLEGEKIRQSDYAFQAGLSGEQPCHVEHYDLDIRLRDDTSPLEVSAGLRLSNPHSEPLHRLIFSLNRELRVSQVRWGDGAAIPFRQEHHLLLLDIGQRPLAAGSTDSICIDYAGQVDADGFMLARLPESKGLISKDNGPWVQGNISAWAAPDFAVLPPECGWYPTPGVTAGYPFTSPRLKNFATASLNVATEKSLQTITQGLKISEREEGAQKISEFRVQSPVQGLSLNIGSYKRLAHQFPQTEIELFVHPNHLLDYELFADVADTCFEAVESMLDVFEQVAGVPYPYEKLSIVEVPLQMQVYSGRYGVTNILQQPGVIMVDEVTIASERLKKQVDQETKRARRKGRDDSPGRIKRDVFIELVLDVFMNDRFWRPSGSMRSPFPNYVNFQIDLRNPTLDRAFQLLGYEEAERRIRDLFYPDRWNLGMSGYDRMRQNEWGSWTVSRRYGIEIDSLISTLTSVPLAEIEPERDGNLYRACVDFKAPPILQMLKQRLGEEEYLKMMEKLLAENQYGGVDATKLLAACESVSGEDMTGFFNQWFEQSTFPGYRISSASARKYDTGKMKIVYEVSARVQNGERGDGFVRVICETENDKIQRNLSLSSFEEKEIRFPVKEEPKNIKVVPYFSRNRGTILKEVSIDNRVARGTPQDTVYSVTSAADSLFFVLDDQDNGFFTPTSAEAKYLRPPSKGQSWWENTNPFAFGKYYFGWRVKRGGSGEYPARWETMVPQAGEYELSFYYRAERSWYGRNASKKFKIEVTGSEGTFPIEFQPQSTADGWYPLGRFRFAGGESAVVELSDEGSGYVIADAIRWEFIE